MKSKWVYSMKNIRIGVLNANKIIERQVNLIVYSRYLNFQRR